MSALPPLTLSICTYKRPWYGIMTLQALIRNVDYAGHKRFHIADGGSSDEEMYWYREVLKGHDHSVSVTSNLSDMVNSCAWAAGEVWLVTLDDFMPHFKFDITPDVRFLLENPDVGAIRMGRLSFWEHGPDERIRANLRMLGGTHWWVIDKEYSNHPYIRSLNTTLYHRRFWDAYGNIPACAPDVPGEAELLGASIYNTTAGPTIAVPMRFGQDCGQEFKEVFAHVGCWRTDEYAASGGGRRM